MQSLSVLEWPVVCQRQHADLERHRPRLQDSRAGVVAEHRCPLTEDERA